MSYEEDGCIVLFGKRHAFMSDRSQCRYGTQSAFCLEGLDTVYDDKVIVVLMGDFEDLCEVAAMCDIKGCLLVLIESLVSLVDLVMMFFT